MDYTRINEVNSPSFPVEIILHILLLLSPQELLSLKRVCKQFRAIVNDRSLWSTVYSDAHLPRPPGPFSWQSTEFFQRTLVRSARLAQHWTSQRGVASTHSLKLEFDFDHCTWICGRWLIINRGNRQLVSHDIDTGSEQTLYLLDNQWVSWSAACSTTTRGQLLYVGLCAGDKHSVHRVRLLEFRVDNDSGHLSGPVTHDITISYTGSSVRLQMTSGNTPFVSVAVGLSQLLADALVFDTRNHIFYKFPVPRSEMDTHSAPRARWPCRFDEIVLTTHVTLFCKDSSSYIQRQSIRAYVAPDGETHELRLSHEASINDESVSWSLLRDSIVDPVTGSTSVRLLHCRYGQEFVCVDLILPINSTEEVLPMSIDTHVVFALNNVRNGMNTRLIRSSPDGYARGLCVVGSLVEEYCFCKLAVDATGERCVGVISDWFPFWLGVNPHRWWIDSFDGTRGRVCYINYTGKTIKSAVAADF